MASTASAITVRPATTADVPRILTFIRELAEYEKLSHDVVATEALLLEHLFGSRSVAEALIAELDHQPAGFALFFHNFSTFLACPGIYLEDLYVRPALRGRGVGKALLLHVVKLAHQRGCGRVEWSVLNWNEPAIGFYRSLGAGAMDEWTVYRLDAAAIERMAAER